MVDQNKKRLDALDIFRGLTIISMIIVNSPGTYGQLSHAYWDGLTLTDFVFPFFIFISGVTISFHITGQPLSSAQSGLLLRKILSRTAIIFVLGLVVNLFYTEFSAFRISGVLQRIAIVYCISSILAMYFRAASLILIAAFILVSYWLILLFVPAPGVEAGVLERGNNIVNWVDYKFLPGMLWRGTWDPERLLSTYPAIVTGIIGVLAGKAIRRAEPLSERVNVMFVGGFCAFIIGYCWSFFFLFNKALWSSSFVLVTGGVACLLLALLIWALDIKAYKRFTFVPRVFGLNAIFAYILHVVLHKALDVQVFGHSVHGWFTGVSADAGLPKDLVSTIWIVAFLGLCFLPTYILYKKKLFLKV